MAIITSAVNSEKNFVISIDVEHTLQRTWKRFEFFNRDLVLRFRGLHSLLASNGIHESSIEVGPLRVFPTIQQLLQP